MPTRSPRARTWVAAPARRAAYGSISCTPRTRLVFTCALTRVCSDAVVHDALRRRAGIYPVRLHIVLLYARTICCAKNMKVVTMTPAQIASAVW